MKRWQGVLSEGIVLFAGAALVLACGAREESDPASQQRRLATGEAGPVDRVDGAETSGRNDASCGPRAPEEPRCGGLRYLGRGHPEDSTGCRTEAELRRGAARACAEEGLGELSSFFARGPCPSDKHWRGHGEQRYSLASFTCCSQPKPRQPVPADYRSCDGDGSLPDGALACWGWWDYGDCAGEDTRMCGRHGANATGCVVPASKCRSGLAKAVRVRSMGPDDECLISVWDYVCVERDPRARSSEAGCAGELIHVPADERYNAFGGSRATQSDEGTCAEMGTLFELAAEICDVDHFAGPEPEGPCGTAGLVSSISACCRANSVPYAAFTGRAPVPAEPTPEEPGQDRVCSLLVEGRGQGPQRLAGVDEGQCARLTVDDGALAIGVRRQDVGQTGPSNRSSL